MIAEGTYKGDTMATARDFFIALPKLCKADNAERWATINAMQFDTELMGNTMFDRSDKDRREPFNRIETAFGFTAFKHDQDRARYCKLLGEIFILAHYSIEHGESQHDARISALVESAKEYKGRYPDIDEYMTPELAAVDGGWK